MNVIERKILVVPWTLLCALAIGCGDPASTAEPDAGSDDTTTPDTVVSGDADIDPGGNDADVEQAEVSPDVDQVEVQDTADADVEEEIGPAVCMTDVCYSPLEFADYPEAQDPPVQALHCNEQGIGNGCPPGTFCGPVTQLTSQIRKPVCVAEGLDSGEFDLTFGQGSEMSQSDDEAVEVHIEFRLDGRDFPLRNEALFTAFPWRDRITFTHRVTGQQWTEPIPADPTGGFDIDLRPGLHDVWITLNPADFVGAGVPETVQRGVLDVGSADTGVIDLRNPELTLTLRYRGNVLTGAESSIFRAWLTGDNGQVVFHQFTQGERGIAALRVPEGTYTLSLASNGSLPSLFPAVPLVTEVPIRPPGTTEVLLDLDPLLVSGSVTVNGEPLGSEDGPVGTLLFAQEGTVQRVPMDTRNPGTFLTLLWSGQRYDVLFQGVNNQISLVESDWRPDDGADFEFDLETVSFDLEATGLPRGQELSSMVQSLVVRNRALPSQVSWYYQNSSTNRTHWEIEMIPGQVLDISLQLNGGTTLQGRWPIAEELEVQSENTISVPFVQVSISSSFEWQDGTPIGVTGNSAYFYREGDENMMSGSVNLGSTPTTYTVIPGTVSVYVYPGWNGDRTIPRQQYRLGEFELEEGASLDLRGIAYMLYGDIFWNGERMSIHDDYYRGLVQWYSQNAGGNAVWLQVDQREYELGVAAGIYTASFTCRGEDCSDEGLGTNALPVWDAVQFMPED